ncbi:head-tail connector protein [Aeromonas sobria]|uniref:head-tail connector protein n=1 Tax=Aeromonas sobria TaxID=646 RepID=UPI000C6CA5E3|nr:head-tail connector protein [Aeromonas sobria]PKQ78085.1 hypothetical protein CJF47_07335 [Aeromonas sobria]
MTPFTNIIPDRDFTTGTNTCVSVDEIKAHLRIAHSIDDAIINDVIRGAQGYVEKYLNRMIRGGSRTQFFTSTDQSLVLPKLSQRAFKIKSVKISGIKNSAPVYITLLKNVQFTFSKNTLEPKIVGLVDSDSEFTIDVVYESLWATSVPDQIDSIPMDIIYAVKLICGTLYQMKSDVSIGVQTFKAPFGAMNLLNPYKV